MPVDRALHVLRQLRLQRQGLLDETRHVGRGVGDRQAGERRAPVDRVLHAEHAAPRVAEHVVTLEAEGAAHGVDLLDGALERPERLVLDALGAPAAELVPVDHLAAVGQVVERREVVVAKPGAAVDGQERKARALAEDTAVQASNGVVTTTAAQDDLPGGFVDAFTDAIAVHRAWSRETDAVPA